MLLYLYALADGLTDVSGLAGVENEPLILLPVGATTAVGGWITQAPAVERDTLIRQDRVVRDLHARAAALLPLRFGTSKADAAAVALAVDALGPNLRARFDLVRGRDQMTLRVLGAAGAASATGTAGALRAEADAGARYLAARAAKASPYELEPLLDALRTYQRATKIEAGRHAGLIGTVYQLIDRGASEAYRRTAEEAATKLPDLTVRITGPAPAYAFAGFDTP